MTYFIKINFISGIVRFCELYLKMKYYKNVTIENVKIVITITEHTVQTLVGVQMKYILNILS